MYRPFTHQTDAIGGVYCGATYEWHAALPVDQCAPEAEAQPFYSLVAVLLQPQPPSTPLVTMINELHQRAPHYPSLWNDSSIEFYMINYATRSSIVLNISPTLPSRIYYLSAFPPMPHPCVVCSYYRNYLPVNNNLPQCHNTITSLTFAVWLCVIHTV
jgi:hypothetical protein